MKINIPNMLSLFRIIVAPFLLLSGWLGMPTLFFTLFGLMLFSDVLDGIIARAWDQTSKLGAKLDSYGDIVTYLSTLLAAWWLWPDVIKEEIVYITVAICIYILPAFFSLAKFGQLASYHTWMTKALAVLMSASIVMLLGFENPLLFHISVYFLAITAIENIAITLILPQPKNNIRTLWHAFKNRD